MTSISKVGESFYNEKTYLENLIKKNTSLEIFDVLLKKGEKKDFHEMKDELDLYIKEKIDFIFNEISNNYFLNELTIGGKKYYEIGDYNNKGIYDENLNKILIDCNILKDGNREYQTRYYFIDGKYYYTGKKRTNDENFIQIYDLKNKKGNIKALPVIFNKGDLINKTNNIGLRKNPTEILYKGEEGDKVFKYIGEECIIQKENGVKEKINCKTGEITEYVEKIKPKETFFKKILKKIL